jgi:antitoxin (DNA-binding transcriptional repressor) of toxin-antitoxin stability system
MKTLSATVVARSFSRILDSLEHGSEEIVVVRNNHPVARLLPGAARMNAIEALGDLYRTLDGKDGDAWLVDVGTLDKVVKGGLRDPWA